MTNQFVCCRSCGSVVTVAEQKRCGCVPNTKPARRKNDEGITRNDLDPDDIYNVVMGRGTTPPK